jgi:hypothetical protein
MACCEVVAMVPRLAVGWVEMMDPTKADESAGELVVTMAEYWDRHWAGWLVACWDDPLADLWGYPMAA